MSDLIDKVSKLLRQAERAGTEAEREVFMAKAQSLATVASIDLAVARQRADKREAREVPESRKVVLGDERKRGNDRLMRLFSTIASTNQVKILIYGNGYAVEALGFPTDIDVSVALFESLVVQMKTAAAEFLATGEYKKETTQVARYERDRYWGDKIFVGYKEKPVDGRVARSSFEKAWTAEVGVRLRQARDEAESAAVAADLKLSADELVNFNENKTAAPVKSSTEIALAAKEVELADFYKSRTRGLRGSYKGGQSRGHSSTASSAGRAAGARASFGTAAKALH